MNNKVSLKSIYWAFFRVGIMTFGGGYAMIPILDRELCETRNWVTNEELMDYYAIGQCTPGVIAVNTATFVGYKLAGDIGGIIATLGVVSPSLIIISIIALLITKYSDISYVQHAFAGIRVCVCILILNSVIKLFKKSVKDIFSIILFCTVLALSIIFDLTPILFVVLSAFLGISLQFIKTKEIK